MIRSEAADLSWVDPLALGRLLRVNGWQKQAETDAWAVWVKPVTEGDAEVSLPRDTTARDFEVRVREAIETVTTIERWSTTDLLLGLRSAGSDMIVSRYPEVDGRLSLPSAVQAVSALRELILAGASAAVEPRPVYRTVKPTEAVEYLDEVDLVAPEPGSFVLRALSPVPPVLDPQLRFEGVSDAPFSRRAVEQLYVGVVAAASAARAVIEEGDSKAFASAVADGVSANLCEALHGIARANDHGSLEFAVQFASVRPSSLFPDRSRTPLVRLGALEIEQITEAGRVFRQSEPDYDAVVEGIVVRLHRDEPASQHAGEVTLSAWHQGGMRQIRLKMGADVYGRFIQAHSDGSVVTVECDIERHGDRFVGRRGRLVEVGPPPGD